MRAKYEHDINMLKIRKLVILALALLSVFLGGTLPASADQTKFTATKCGPYFVYIDREVYRKKGCGFSPCFTFSEDGPGSRSEYVQEAFTIVHRVGKSPRVYYRGRDIPRRNLQPVSFSWNPFHTFGTGSYIVENGTRHYCVPY